MQRIKTVTWAGMALLGLGVMYLYSCGAFQKKISFNAQIRPLNANCTSCHGGVKKAGNVSFLYREEALG